MNPSEKLANEIIETCQVSGLSLVLEPVKNPRYSPFGRDPDFRIFISSQDTNLKIGGRWSRKPHIEVYSYSTDEAYAVFQVEGVTEAQIRAVSTVKKRLEAIIAGASANHQAGLTLAAVEENVRKELLAIGIQPGLSFLLDVDKAFTGDVDNFYCKVRLRLPDGGRTVFLYDSRKEQKLTLIQALGQSFSAPQAIMDEKKGQLEQEYLASCFEIVKSLKRNET